VRSGEENDFSATRTDTSKACFENLLDRTDSKHFPYVYILPDDMVEVGFESVSEV
jgi:hypothetical protein